MEPVICPFCVGEIKGRCGWVPLLSSLQVVFLDVRQMADSTTVFLIFFSLIFFSSLYFSVSAGNGIYL